MSIHPQRDQQHITMEDRESRVTGDCSLKTLIQCSALLKKADRTLRKILGEKKGGVYYFAFMIIGISIVHLHHDYIC